MSKNAVIKEGDIGRKISPLTKLKVDKQSSGSSYWLSGEDHMIDEKSITSNGLYLPADDNLFAYSQLNVDVQFGNMISSNGKTVYVDKNGDLQEDGLPTEIRATMPSGESYTAGDKVDLTSVVVTAYKSNGEVWTDDDYPDGIIPYEELTFSDDVDHIPFFQKRKVPETMIPEYTKAEAIDVYVGAILDFYYAYSSVYGTNYKDKNTLYMIHNPVVVLANHYTPNSDPARLGSYSVEATMAAYSDGTNVAEYWKKWASDPYYEPAHFESMIVANKSFTYQRKTVYWASITDSGSSDINKLLVDVHCEPDVPRHNDYYDRYNHWNRDALAWVALYGERLPWTYDIGISWNRPVDQQELTTTLSIGVDTDIEEQGNG